jgi:hypothetical protein
MTKTITQPAIEVSTWDQRARAADQMRDSLARYFAARAARAAGQRQLFRQLRALARAHVNVRAVKRLYEAARRSRWDAVAPLGMIPA